MSTRCVAVLLCWACAACAFERLERHGASLSVSSEPPGATVVVEDVTGSRAAGATPLKLDVAYDERTQHFNPFVLLLPAVGGAALAWGIPEFMRILSSHAGIEAKTFVPMLIAVDGGGVTAIVGVIDTIKQAVQNGDPVPDPELLKKRQEKLASGVSSSQQERIQEELRQSAFTPIRVTATAPGYIEWTGELPRPPDGHELRMQLYPARGGPPPAPLPAARSSCVRDDECGAGQACVDGGCVNP